MASSLSHRSAVGSARLILVLVLLVSGSATALAGQATPDASPVAEGSRLYVGHNAGLATQIPDGWEVDRSQRYGYAGPDGFIDSSGLWVMNSAVDSIEAMCAEVAADPWYFEPAGTIAPTTFHELPACEIRTATDAPDDPVALVFTHPAPREDATNRYAFIVVDSAHFETVVARVTFDPTAVTAEAYLDAAIDLIAANWLWRDAIDWDALRAEAHAEAGGPAAAGDFAAAHRALGRLTTILADSGVTDPYLIFLSPADMAGFGPPSGLPDPRGEALPGGIGYLALPALLDTGDAPIAYADTIHTAIADQRETACGWVVDLRGNVGGDLYAMYGALAPLLPPGTLLTFRYVSGAAFPVTMDEAGAFRYGGTPLQGMDTLAAPSDPALRDRPLAVLIDGQTSASGEMVAITLAGRDDTRFFGEPTYGAATTANAGLSLYDGAYLDFSAAEVIGPNGATYPDGIVPDAATRHTGGITDPVARDPVVQEAMAWLDAHPACASASATPAA